MAGNARGDLAVAWQPYCCYLPDRYSVRPAGNARWSAPAEPIGSFRVDPASVDPVDRIQALAVDNAGSLHLLVSNASVGGQPQLRYVTNATGAWTSALIPPAPCKDPADCLAFPIQAMMAYDPSTHRLVLAERHHEMRLLGGRSQDVSVMTIADKPAAAVAFGPSHEAPATRHWLAPTSLCARGGQITSALAAWRKHRAPYVMTGTGPDTMGLPVRVRGTTRRDVAVPLYDDESRGGMPTAAEASRDRVFIAWQRDSLYRRPSWNRRQQGIWLREYVRDPASGAWHFLPAQHITNSAYDRLDALTVGANGPAVGYTTFN